MKKILDLFLRVIYRKFSFELSIKYFDIIAKNTGEATGYLFSCNKLRCKKDIPGCLLRYSDETQVYPFLPWFKKLSMEEGMEKILSLSSGNEVVCIYCPPLVSHGNKAAIFLSKYINKWYCKVGIESEIHKWLVDYFEVYV